MPEEQSIEIDTDAASLDMGSVDSRPLTLELANAADGGVMVHEYGLSFGATVAIVGDLLAISQVQAERLVAEAERLYIGRMRERFSGLRVSERLRRTNPFLLRIRGAKTVREWATLQIQSALYASEEEAVGHLLEAIAKICFPGASDPTYPDDFDLEVPDGENHIDGYQIKMSWDCMPMSSRKNLSNTVQAVTKAHEDAGRSFTGYFAPCYGRAKTSQAPGQAYVSMASKEFWTRVGGGREDYDVAVGEVCALLCAEFRLEVLESLVPKIIADLTDAAESMIGDEHGNLDYRKLFRTVNK